LEFNALKKEEILKKTVSFIIVLVLFLGAAWMGCSWWFGRQVESQYRQLLVQAASNTGARIDLESYSRDWMGATARARVAFDLPVAKKGTKSLPLAFTVITRIVNGPFPGGPAGLRPAMALLRTRVALGPDLLALVRSEWPACPEELPMTSTTVIYIGGDGESWASAEPFHQTLGQAEALTIDWQGLSGHSTFTPGFRDSRGDWRMPALEVAGKEGRMRLAGLTATFDLHFPQGLGGQMFGDVDYSLQSLEFALNGSQKDKGLQVALQDLALKGSSRQTEDLINGTLKASFRQLTVNGAVNGPGVWDMQVTNIDASALNELQQFSRRIGREQAGVSPEEVQAQTMADLGKIWPRIAARSPALEIRELSLEGPDGHLRCNGRIAVDGSNQEALTSPMLLPQALSAQASVEVSAPLLQKAMRAVVRQKLANSLAAAGQPPLPEEQLDSLAAAGSEQGVAALVEKGILVPKGSTYTLTANYRPGEASLNGQPIPLN
jgi:uncharacterized protein YdgA (DUF945 family)